MSQQGASTYLSNIFQGVAGNLVFMAGCGVCAALGWVKGADIGRPENWPLWIAAVIVFGTVGFVGGGGSAMPCGYGGKADNRSRKSLSLMTA